VPASVRENKVKKQLLKWAFQQWMPAADALLDMIINKLPSPQEAQRYRAAQLYEGPLDDPCGRAIRDCDKNGPLMMYVSKMVPIGESGRFYAFGRVFSGTVTAGQKVRILGPNYQPGSKKDLFIQNVQRVVLMMGGKVESVPEVPCGNTCCLVGIDSSLRKAGTITDYEEAHSIKAMKFTVSPVVRVSVAPKFTQDLPKLVEGLKKLVSADSMVQVSHEDSGEYVVAGCGELHVEICLNDLETHAKCEIKRGQPIVSYRETVVGTSDRVCLAKSSNKHNRIYMTAEPTGAALTTAIDDGRITALMDPKLRTRQLVEEFEWDPNDAKKIWAFGPEVEGTNFLVDQSTAVSYLNEARDSIENAFQWASYNGVLTEEPLRGVKFNLRDATIHSQSAHRGGA
jgi:elongation factor 2